MIVMIFFPSFLFWWRYDDALSYICVFFFFSRNCCCYCYSCLL